jgi:hypothetical protein
MSRRLGRSLTSETNARPTTWGKLCEPFAYQKLGFDYDLVSDVTLVHPDYPFWVGSPDVTKTDTVGDIKCPMTLKSFCTFVDAVGIGMIRKEHTDGEKYYWQLVSNSILTNSTYAELIVFVPYRADLQELRLMAMDVKEYRWVEYADDWELPFLIEGKHYQDLNIIRFEVPQSDKDLLTECVERAGKLLI